MLQIKRKRSEKKKIENKNVFNLFFHDHFYECISIDKLSHIMKIRPQGYKALVHSQTQNEAQ